MRQKNITIVDASSAHARQWRGRTDPLPGFAGFRAEYLAHFKTPPTWTTDTRACITTRWSPPRGAVRLSVQGRSGDALVQNLRRGHYHLTAGLPSSLRLAAAFDELRHAI